MRYLLDTNVWLPLPQSGRAGGESIAADTCPRDRGLLRRRGGIAPWPRKYGRREERVAKVGRTLSPFRSLPFADAAARRYAEIRDDLETRGAIIGPNDLLIAAIALANDLTMVTSDHEFTWVEGLRTEDWRPSEIVVPRSGRRLCRM